MQTVQDFRHGDYNKDLDRVVRFKERKEKGSLVSSKVTVSNIISCIFQVIGIVMRNCNK